jgi:hypothetical protein
VLAEGRPRSVYAHHVFIAVQQRTVSRDIPWTSASEGRLLRNRLSVRLLRCNGTLRPGNIAGTGVARSDIETELQKSTASLGGDDSVVLPEKESSESERLRLSWPAMVKYLSRAQRGDKSSREAARMDGIRNQEQGVSETEQANSFLRVSRWWWLGPG